jgi:hypothetical protein
MPPRSIDISHHEIRCVVEQRKTSGHMGCTLQTHLATLRNFLADLAESVQRADEKTILKRGMAG